MDKKTIKAIKLYRENLNKKMKMLAYCYHPYLGKIYQFWSRKAIKKFYKRFGFIPKSPKVIVLESIK